MVPAVLSTALRRSEPRAEHDHLRFYAELASEQDPAQSFPAPTSEPQISSRPAKPIAEWIARGSVENIPFDSGFRAVNPAMRDSAAAMSAITWCTPSTGATKTGRIRRCA